MRRTLRTDKELRRLSNMRAAKRRKFVANAAEWKTVRIITDENVLTGKKTVIECCHDGGNHNQFRIRVNGEPRQIRTRRGIDKVISGWIGG